MRVSYLSLDKVADTFITKVTIINNNTCMRELDLYIWDTRLFIPVNMVNGYISAIKMLKGAGYVYGYVTIA